MVAAELSIREMGSVTLAGSLELVALVAMKDPPRHLDAFPAATLDDVGFVVSSLRQLGGRRHGYALSALRDMAEEASSQRGVLAA